MEIDHNGRALELAREALERTWPAERFQLELEEEHEPRWNHRFDRIHYGAAFRVFEHAGLAAVTVVPQTRAVTRVRFPVEANEIENAQPLEAADGSLARAAAEDAARRSGRWHALRSEVVAARPSETRDAVDVLVRLRAAAPEGPLTVELDAATGERLAFFAPCLLRSSRSGKPLSKGEAIARAHEVVPVADVRCVAAVLEEPAGARLWNLRFESSGLTLTGHASVSIHARSGLVVGITSTLRPRVKLGRGPTRDRACARIEQALPLLLGEGARLANLVEGAVVNRGAPRAAWVGTALTGEGRVVRVSFAADLVEVALDGKPLRARVDSDRAVLVNDTRRKKRERRAEPVAAREGEPTA